jgi:hypothetical protein
MLGHGYQSYSHSPWLDGFCLTPTAHNDSMIISISENALAQLEALAAAQETTVEYLATDLVRNAWNALEQSEAQAPEWPTD